MAPDDDRVWLALADLATRSGRFEEAGDLLTRCERARPDDIRRCGGPGSNGRRPPTGLTNSCARQATCPLRALPRGGC